MLGDKFIVVDSEKLEQLIDKCISKSMAKEFNNLPISAIKSKELLTIEQLIEKIKVSKATIYNWKKRGYIKGLKKGNTVFYDYDEVIRSMNSCEQLSDKTPSSWWDQYRQEREFQKNEKAKVDRVDK